MSIHVVCLQYICNSSMLYVTWCCVADRNQRAFIKCTECPKGMEVHFGSVTQFCEHLRKDHADKDIKPYKCNQCDYRCMY